MSFLSKTTIALITFYQKTVSPNHGKISTPFLAGSCKFYPTCSVYTKEAIKSKGFFRGFAKGLWRILRCGPFSYGGYDPL